MNKKLDIELQIRLKEQLSELIETYGFSNVNGMLASIQDQDQAASPPPASTVVQANPPQNVSYKKDEQPPLPPKPEMPNNIHNIEDFEVVVKDFAAKDKIKPELLSGITIFIQNAKLILSGKYKEVSEDFIINLTSISDLVQVATPEEDWIMYNSEIIRKQLKRKLRLVGYDFMDSEVEVGKLFDEERHNIVGKEPVSNTALVNRVLKVRNEGLIIQRKLHINANVIVGSEVDKNIVS